MNTRKVLFIFVGLMLSVAASAQWDASNLYMTKSLSKDAIRNVYARTSGGAILVAGTSEAEAKIEVYIRPNGRESISKDEIKRRLDDDYELEVTASGGKLTAVAKPRGFNISSRNQLSIAFRIYVPKNSSTDVGTSGGSIELSDLTGEQNFSTSGGSLNVAQLKGRIRGKTSGGGISLVNCSDDMELTTSGGTIDAENCTGSIRLSTSGGSINLDKLKGTINAKTSGGSVRGLGIDGELITHTSGGSIRLANLSGSVDASTSGGSIDMQIDQLGKYVNASNSGGNIEIKLPRGKGVDLRLRAERINMNAIENFSGDKEDHRVNGKLNGGGTPVEVSTSGTITLAQQ